MTTLAVRLPPQLAADIELEARARGVSKSTIVRERLQHKAHPRTTLADIADLIGSVEGMAPDLSQKTTEYLRRAGYGQKRSG